MEAFLMAAGLGTRLKPITLTRPKALVEIAGRTLLEINIEHLARQGATRVVVNIHHFAEMMKGFIRSRSWDCEVLVSDESPLLMDTGGGLKQAASLFSHTQPIVIYNVDVLSCVPIQAMLRQHQESGALATLAVSHRSTRRYLLFDDSQRLVGWRNQATGEERWAQQAMPHSNELAFSGISIVSPKLLDLLPPAKAPYPIIPEYLRLAKDHGIYCRLHPASQWLDVGKPETLPLAEDFIKSIEQNR